VGIVCGSKVIMINRQRQIKVMPREMRERIKLME